MSTVHVRVYVVVIALTILGTSGGAQRQPATIPTVVAAAMTWQPLFPFEVTPEYFDARTPPDWPSDLVPSGARVIGGGSMGVASFFRTRVAVFEFSAASDPIDALRTLVTRAGYARFEPHEAKTEGFVPTEPQAGAGPTRYCNASNLVTFRPVDSARAPRVIEVDLLDGEAARQSCTDQARPADMRHPPVTLPALTPPPGVKISGGGGTSWSGNGGEARTEVYTSMSADSVLGHYAGQLVAAGWKREGRTVAADGIAVQRFSFHQNDANWSAALMVFAAGDKRDIRIEFNKVE